MLERGWFMEALNDAADCRQDEPTLAVLRLEAIKHYWW
jgi:hypothetical protein